jgi:Tfp pilus assembly protein PilV
MVPGTGGKGQTLVEVLVAIGITTMALVAILSIAFSYLTMGGQSAERTIAVFLAREGLELVRGIRDSYWLNPTKVWPYGLENGNYIIDSSTNTLTAADNTDINQCNNCRLYITSANLYTHTQTGNTLTIFKRMITISTGDDLGQICPDSGDGCEKKIESKVSWTERNRTHQITLEERLTDWR